MLTALRNRPPKFSGWLQPGNILVGRREVILTDHRFLVWQSTLLAAMTENSLKYPQQNSLCIIAIIQIIIINVLAVVQTWSNAHWIGSVIGFPCPVLSWFPPRALWVVETLHISCNSRQVSVRSHYWCVWALSRPRHINSILDLWSSGAPALVCSGGRFFLRIFSGLWFIGITPGMTLACQFNLTPSFRSQYSTHSYLSALHT